MLLARLDDYTPRALVDRWLPDSEDSESLLDKLLARYVLVAQGSDADLRDRELDAWSWPLAARWFHCATRRVEFESDRDRQRADLLELARETEPPSPYLRRGDGDLRLPAKVDSQQGGLWEILRSRRTVRQFERTAIDLESFATVLRWTWGAVSHHVGELGPFIAKASPSGGGRHPIEVYPLVLRVDGLPRGLYHYRVEDDTLGFLRAGIADSDAAQLVASQWWVADAAVVFLMTAVLKRSMWKYKHAHALRVVSMDAGHLGQTFHLVCTALGLAPFTSAALDTAAVERVLGIDGISEIAVYAAVTGWPSGSRGFE